MLEISKCEVCGNKNLESVLDLGEHPMCDDLVNVGEDRQCVNYPIEIMFCNICQTAHQRFQVPKAKLFPSNYHYRSRFTADVLSGMVNLVDECEQRFGELKKKVVLDIGCNDGSLLNFFRDKGGITVGVEPTDACLDAIEQGHCAYNQYLSEKLSEEILLKHGFPSIIVFTNVFAHIENLAEVISSLKKLVGPETTIVIENHYLGSVLKGKQFDTFYHEHPRTYSYSSFVYIAKLLGMELVDVDFPARYGGNIRVYFSVVSGQKPAVSPACIEVKEQEKHFFSSFTLLSSNIENWRQKKRNEIVDLVGKFGKLKAKAFPGRAAILVKLLELDDNHISAVYEKPGSMKIGTYLPGTRIPILSDNELFDRLESSTPVLNLAWHISAEIREYLLEHGYSGQVIDILSEEDFQVLD
ncbi:class I SAM-dependent methyltransferase [Spartinivicinus poritis]|uniref:Class I SAM-dependent methyltransferase n=1 Tax=Spartinivicinus poritis TaxID=2994640 RepID=A0ABT5U7U4_9GAMM|nr:class I SAM-dependent methyltransferase [Spartinivicinus sp. A2-2]MDE1462270.1 class I SAM-dependent methyltransferase [Spartinivicinus sp. A2-2]